VSGQVARTPTLISRPILCQHSRRDERPTRIGRLAGSRKIFLIFGHHLRRNKLNLEQCDRLIFGLLLMIADDDARMAHVLNHGVDLTILEEAFVFSL
jgi:hypothetical protein